MKRISREQAEVYTFDRSLPPKLRIAPGEKFILETDGASSGYLVVDVTDAMEELQVGDELGFYPNYSALLRAMSSEYVRKCPLRSSMIVETE